MSAEKKAIEEMAKVIQDGELDRNRGDLDCSEFPTDIVIKVGLQRLAGAKALYNAGYRKADEVRKETAREILSEMFKQIKGYENVDIILSRIAKQFGVEVEE